jgi:DNA-binding NtrC family response regulator
VPESKEAGRRIEMGIPLRVLVVEDSEEDTLLMLRELRRGGYDVTHRRVETRESMHAALAGQAWDVVLSDYRMPHFSAPDALQVLKESGLDLPFIIVSGTVGEETAVASMKAGAHDYLLKSNLIRLCAAIASRTDRRRSGCDSRAARWKPPRMASSLPTGMDASSGRIQPSVGSPVTA